MASERCEVRGRVDAGGAGWRSALAMAHRWTGIVCGALFVVWFASGIVMLYARMPALDPAERLRRMPPLDSAPIRVAPAAAVIGTGIVPQRLRIGMLGDRPVYRFASAERWTTVFADNGEPLRSLTPAQALDIAARFLGEPVAELRHDGRLLEPDQWTLQSRELLPAHRIAADDEQASRLYISERTGEPVLKTTRRGRLCAYLGPVPHWLYFTPLRRHPAVWTRTVILLALAGCFLCLSGLAWGLLRLSTRRQRCSPYSGLMRWHHYAGLLFGAAASGWILSGLLSMDPWSWHPGTTPSAAQREAAAGGSLQLSALTVERLEQGIAALAAGLSLREVEVVQLLGRPYLMTYRLPASPTAEERFDVSDVLSPLLPFPTRLVSATEPASGVFGRFARARMLEAARAAMPQAEVVELRQLERYDAYYYDRHGRRPLPVLRVVYDDPARTALYLDAARGRIVHREQRRTRLNRWLYHGLHSLDFPPLYDRRPLWDVAMILLLSGGLVLSLSPAKDGCRRLWRHVTRLGRGP